MILTGHLVQFKPNYNSFYNYTMTLRDDKDEFHTIYFNNVKNKLDKITVINKVELCVKCESDRLILETIRNI